MSFEQIPERAAPKKLRWIVLVALALLFIAAVAGILGPFLVVVSLGVIVLGVVALIRGRLLALNISNKRGATGVLLLGVYLLAFGAVTSATSQGTTPVAVGAGDSCEVVGAINEQETESFYCTPSSSGELAWASEVDFTAYQEAEAEEIEAAAQEEAQAATKELEKDVAQLEKDLTAAEKRSEDADTKVAGYKEQLDEQKEATAKAEEQAASAR